jgi:hypothetical protein
MSAMLSASVPSRSNTRARTSRNMPLYLPDAWAPARDRGDWRGERRGERGAWAIDLALGGQSLTAKDPGAQAVGFGGLELAARFRIVPAMEVALAFDAAGNQGIGLAGFLAEFRYHFMAERPWTPFVLGGLGIVSVADKTGTETEKKGRGALRVGGGIERRFGAWGLEATLRLMGIGENKQVMDVTTRGQELARYSASGVELVIGGTFYF